MTDIPYVNISAQWYEERDELLPILDRVMSSGQYIGGVEVESFEREAALEFGVDYVVALNSGTDALVYGLAAMGIGQGDEVITPPNSFVASTAAIVSRFARRTRFGWIPGSWISRPTHGRRCGSTSTS